MKNDSNFHMLVSLQEPSPLVLWKLGQFQKERRRSTHPYFSYIPESMQY